MMEMLSYQLQLHLHKLVLPCLIHPAKMLQLPWMHQLAYLLQPAFFEHTPWSFQGKAFGLGLLLLQLV